MLFYGFKTGAECKALCEDARREVPVPDGVLEEVYEFHQDGRFKMVKGGKMPPGHERMVKEINYPGFGADGLWNPSSVWNGWPHNFRDHFYAIWEGNVTVKEAGNYTFFTTSDAGSRLLVDDTHVVDNPGWHGFKRKEGSIQLTAGKHPFSADFFEGVGESAIEVHWQGPDTGNQMVIMKHDDADITEKGFKFVQNGQFHDVNKEETPKNPKATRKVKNINYPHTGNNWLGWTIRDNFYARWSGYIKIKAAGRYTFYTKSDDGSRLYIDDKSLVDNADWHSHMQQREGTIENMAAGKHKFWAEMFAGTGSAGMEMFYRGPDTGNHQIIVPENVLFSGVPGGETVLNADWMQIGKCAAYSFEGSNETASSCILYTECTEIGVDADSKVCEGDGSTNGFDVHPAAGVKTCKFTSGPPANTSDGGGGGAGGGLQ